MTGFEPRPLESELTALPPEPQPMPKVSLFNKSLLKA